jgi:ferredoxin-NADP reductase/cytochrome c2
MLETSLSTIISIIFVLVGAINVWLIFHAANQLQQQGKRARLIQAHRWGGYLFLLLYAVMTYFMVLKLRDTSEELALRPLVHMLLAMLLVPLMFVKILIARYYKTYYNSLMPLGLVIFSLSFVLVALTAGPYLLRKATVKEISLAAVNMGSNQIDLEAARTLTDKKCSKCHNLDRVASARKDERGWLATINRMRTLPGSTISETDGVTILAYLVTQNGPQANSTTGQNVTAANSVGKSLVDTRCNRCHDLDRVYSASKEAAAWRATVTRMVAYAAGNDGIFKPGDDEQIITFLAETQSPTAVEQRRNQAADLAAKDNRPTPTAPTAITPQPRSGPPATTIMAFVILGIFFGLLVWRRPRKATLETNSDESTSASIAVTTTPASSRKQLNLRLARLQKQTADAQTLRFLLPPGSNFTPRPGQFITIDWPINGQKVTRSYTICSSPTQSGYLEITPKRVAGGLVSNFLNDLTTIGLEVTARGPAGKFYFDEATDKQLVLIAAGSGITPMIAILRYLDDRCLSLPVTLIYGVRTAQDVIFAAELANLAARLPQFRYHIAVSQPTPDWTGLKGRINQTSLQSIITDLAANTYFLCGPANFMQEAQAALLNLGVLPTQIKQESFGNAPGSVLLDQISAEGEVIFARSDRTASLIPGKTVLEVAEAANVAIPYSCRQGQCGTCAKRLLAGSVKMATQDGLDPQLKAAGYILTCVSQAQGDIKLDC